LYTIKLITPKKIIPAIIPIINPTPDEDYYTSMEILMAPEHTPPTLDSSTSATPI
jgi:hypothetical protein